MMSDSILWRGFDMNVSFATAIGLKTHVGWVRHLKMAK